MRHDGRSSRDRQNLAIIDAEREILTTFDQIAVRGCAKDGDHIEVQSAKIGAAKGKHRACVNSRPSASMSRQTVYSRSRAKHLPRRNNRRNTDARPSS